MADSGSTQPGPSLLSQWETWPPAEAADLIALWETAGCPELELVPGVVVWNLRLWFAPTLVPVSDRVAQCWRVRGLLQQENDF